MTPWPGLQNGVGYAQTIANGVVLIAALSLAGVARRASDKA